MDLICNNLAIEFMVTMHNIISLAFNMKYLQENGFTQPIVFRSPTGLEMRSVLQVIAS